MNKWMLVLALLLTSCAPSTGDDDTRFSTGRSNFRGENISDPITGEDYSYIVTSEVEPPLGRSGSIAWGCQGEYLRAFVQLDSELGLSSARVQYRLDELEAISDQGWQVINGSLWFPPATGLRFTAAALGLRSERLALRVFDVDGSPYTYLFDLEGIGSAFSRLPCAQFLFEQAG